MDKNFVINGEELKVQDYKLEAGLVSFKLNHKDYRFTLVQKDGPEMILDDGNRFKAAVGSMNAEGESIVMARGREGKISSGNKKTSKSRVQAGSLVSPMPGKIFKIVKEIGSPVKKGEPILILEAMKMEHSIRADKDGTVKKILFKVGELVQGGIILAEVE